MSLQYSQTVNVRSCDLVKKCEGGPLAKMPMALIEKVDSAIKFFVVRRGGLFKIPRTEIKKVDQIELVLSCSAD